MTYLLNTTRIYEMIYLAIKPERAEAIVPCPFAGLVTDMIRWESEQCIVIPGEES